MRPKTETVKSARSAGVTNPNASWRKTTTATYPAMDTPAALHAPTLPKRNAPVMMTTVATRYVIQPGSLEKRNRATTRTVRSQAKEIAAIPRCCSMEVARPDARRARAPYTTMAAPRRNTPGSERFGKNGPRTMSRAAAPHRMRAIVRSTRCASSSSPSLTRRGDYPSASAMTPPTMSTAAIDLLPISASASVRAPMSTPMRIPISRAGAT